MANRFAGASSGFSKSKDDILDPVNLFDNVEPLAEVPSFDDSLPKAIPDNFSSLQGLASSTSNILSEFNIENANERMMKQLTDKPEKMQNLEKMKQTGKISAKSRKEAISLFSDALLFQKVGLVTLSQAPMEDAFVPHFTGEPSIS